MLSDEQLKQRAGLVTSSVAAAALGEHSRMTPLDAWMGIKGKLKPIEGNKAIDRGNALESLVLDYPCDAINVTRRDAPFVRHPTLDWAGDSADCLYVHSDGREDVGEGKTASGVVAKEWGDEGTDDIPTGALIQSHWHLIHHPQTGRCIVPVLIGGFSFEFRLYYVARDDEFASAIIEDLARWHRDYVVADKPPPATAASDSRNIIAMHPRSLANYIEPSAELERLAREKNELTIERKDVEEREGIAKTKIQELIGSNEGSLGCGWKVTWKNNKDSLKTDWRAVAEELSAPNDIVNKHTRIVAGARVLRVTVKAPTTAKG